jgi:hypothetical protein
VRERLNTARLAALAGESTTKAPSFADIDPWRERGNPLPEPVMRAGDRVSFARFGDYRLYSLSGLSEPEGWGCWIDGACADFVLPVAAESDGALALKLVYRGMIVSPMQPTVPFDVVVNGRLCASLKAQTGADATAIIELPPDLDWRRTGCLAIRIDVHSTLRLCDHGLSPDTRSLGLGLVSLSLDDTARDTP